MGIVRSPRSSASVTPSRRRAARRFSSTSTKVTRAPASAIRTANRQPIAPAPTITMSRMLTPLPCRGMMGAPPGRDQAMIDAELAKLIDDRPDAGVFRVSRAIFDDSALFELEMARIFESGWVFLGLASQAPHPHVFFTATIGRVPILVSRDGAGKLAA